MEEKSGILLIGRSVEVRALRLYLSFHSMRVFLEDNIIQGLKKTLEKNIRTILLDSNLFNTWEINPVQLVKTAQPNMTVMVLGKSGNNIGIVRELAATVAHYFNYPWTGEDVKKELDRVCSGEREEK